ncbi:MAG: TIR domain-containing protein [Anaerolineae bacterium]|nr:TIR domain-containing protein [Anaerolineae bacterium]
MSDVFISYARSDNHDGFINDLFANLETMGIDVWIDKSDIPPAFDFMKEIFAAIEGSDGLIFIVTPQSLASAYCLQELDYAHKLNKRLFPVIRADVDAAVVPTTLKGLDWIFLRNPTEQESGYQRLVAALQSGDQDYVQRHTRLLQRALDWEKNNHPESSLLLGDDLRSAQSWLNTAKANPQPTALHREFVQTSASYEQRLIERENQRIRELNQSTRRAVRSRTAAILTGLVAGVITIAAGLMTSTTISNANATLTPIPQTISAAQAALSTSQSQLVVVASTLTPIPPTLTAFARQVDEGTRAIESQRLASLVVSLLANKSYKFDERFIQSNQRNISTAVLLGIRALSTGYTAEAEAALVSALSQLYTRLVINLPDYAQTISAHYIADGTAFLIGARAYDAQTGTLLHTYAQADGVDSVAAASANGQWVLSGNSLGRLSLWDAASGRLLRQFTLSDQMLTVNDLMFMPDAKSALVLYGYSARLIDLESGSPLRTWQPADRFINSLSLSPDSRTLVTVSDTGTPATQAFIDFWDVSSGELLRSFTISNSVRIVRYAPDGKTIATGDGISSANAVNTIRVWDAATGHLVNTMLGHEAGITSLAYSSDSKRLVSGSLDNTARLWAVDSGDLLRRYSEHASYIMAVNLAPNDIDLLTVSYDKTARLSSADLSTDPNTFLGHHDVVADEVFSPDGSYLLTSSQDGEIKLWDAHTRTLIRSFADNGSVCAMSFSPDSKTFITRATAYGSDGISRLWDIASGKVVYEGERETQDRCFAAYSADGTKAYFSIKQGVRVLDIATGETQTFVRSYTETGLFEISEALYRSGDRVLLILSDDSDDGSIEYLTMWDPLTGEQVRSAVLLECADGNFLSYSMSISADEKNVLIGDQDGTACLYSLETGKALQIFPDHKGIVFDLAFSPDGKTILTASGDGKARLWDIATGKLLRLLSGHTGVVTSVAFAPDGKTAVTGSIDGTVRLWQTDYHDYIAYACTLVFADFGAGLRAQYGIFDDTPTCPQFAQP